jgi:hypothetical protein
MPKHVMQFGDNGADWCIHCGTFDIYCVEDDCEGPQTARFDTVNNAGNYLRIWCATFGDDGLTEEGKAELAKQRALVEEERNVQQVSGN